MYNSIKSLLEISEFLTVFLLQLRMVLPSFFLHSDIYSLFIKASKEIPSLQTGKVRFLKNIYLISKDVYI